MDLSYSDEQRDLRESLATFFSKESTPERVRAAEPSGFDPGLWDKIAAMGLPSMAVAQDLGGGGAGLLDLVLTAEEFGRRIPPAPLLESAVATNLLGRLVGAGATDPARELLAEAVAGDSLVTITLQPLRAGLAKLAPAGAVADAVLALDGDELIAFRSEVSPRSPLEVPANLGSSPLADRGAGIDDGVVLASGPEARAAYGRARQEWQLLMAAALVGLAQTALDMGSDYAQQRQAFGVLIAWFQTVQHRLADAVTDLEGARLLTYEAAWSADEGQDGAPALAAMAFLFTSQVAFRIAAESLHVHGGYGYTLEYDIQLFFRRAKAWPLAGGDPKAGYQELAARLFEREEA
ncbi:MAG TPA: acyl-CoA dehydrogenase family protein [Acidimicrobiales bacterium]|jgi:alkylation response protein AidB-like acyl-CoA dehydrogenase|nr:acyl-CoA dehydrogenase family protein [Acidimicrobiales bacterium]